MIREHVEVSGTKAVFAEEMVAASEPDPAPGTGGSAPWCPGWLGAR